MAALQTSFARLDDVLAAGFAANLSAAAGPHKYARAATRMSQTVNESRAVADAYEEQRALRSLYGKGEPLPPSIGHHPDFEHLLGTDETCRCAITTMFMDIESSTRLSRLFPLEDVRRIKNAFLRTAIQIVKAFDGHVHRIMGDAVMAYFGGRNATVEEGVIDGLNCAAVLRHFVEAVVIPRLRREGFDHDFGVRIGLDHGPDPEVLWSAYGFPEMEEVTATSFYVDVAAKLQQAAGRNRVMLGQSLRDAIDVPETLLSVRTRVRGGGRVECPFVEPNVTGRDGNPVNYRQWDFDADEYLKCSPVAHQGDRFPVHPGAGPVRVLAEEFGEEGAAGGGTLYHAASRALPKGRWLRFKPVVVTAPPFTMTYQVENHGREARAEGCEFRDPETYEIRTWAELQSHCHWESTAYRGLHYMTVRVHKDRRIDQAARFGVYVQ